jgi:hypothetical protein
MSGRLAAIKPTATTPTTLYEAPENKLVSITVSACNQGPGKDWVSIQLSSGTAGAEDYIEYHAEVSESGVIERSGIVLKEGEEVIATSQQGQTSFVAWGISETL